jgi:hypothetical protein
MEYLMRSDDEIEAMEAWTSKEETTADDIEVQSNRIYIRRYELLGSLEPPL